MQDRQTCSALVITCSDFRFKTAEREFASASGLDADHDLIARPGAIRSLVDPRDDAARQSMDDEIRILWSLHGFTRILMLNHLSCRAYDNIASPENEREIHTAHLRQAKIVLESRFPAVTAEAYLAEITPSGIVVAPL